MNVTRAHRAESLIATTVVCYNGRWTTIAICSRWLKDRDGRSPSVESELLRTADGARTIARLG